MSKGGRGDISDKIVPPAGDKIRSHVYRMICTKLRFASGN